VFEEATPLVIREEESRTRPGARAYQRICYLCHLLLPKQNTLWWMFAHIPLGDNKRNLWQSSFSKGTSSPGLARTRACFVKVWKGFARPRARKTLPHFHMSAAGAQKTVIP